MDKELLFFVFGVHRSKDLHFLAPQHIGVVRVVGFKPDARHKAKRNVRDFREDAHLRVCGQLWQICRRRDVFDFAQASIRSEHPGGVYLHDGAIPPALQSVHFPAHRLPQKAVLSLVRRIGSTDTALALR